MLTEQHIRRLFQRLNDKLAESGEVGEIGVVGGAVMCLVYKARPATRDVDAIFEPKTIITKLAQEIAEEENINEDWLNDAAKGFIQPGFLKEEILHLTNLRVWAPEPRYMLAMKCISARWDTSDRDDVMFLLQFLQITSPQTVFQIIEGFYPKNVIPTKTVYFIEEILEKKNAPKSK